MSTTIGRCPTIPSHALLGGVCSGLADQTGLPCWAVRAAAVLALYWHPLVAIAVYFAIAALFRHGRRKFANRRAAWRASMPDHEPPGRFDGLAARFVALDLRLARLEARFAGTESLLRRRFDRL